MRLEPVAKRSPQHARRRPRRPAFHHEMLAVEKIRRVAGIKWKRLESGKRFERRRGPFPSVAKQILGAKSASSARMCADGCRVPVMKIEIPSLSVRRFITPRKLPLLAIQRAVRRAMPLRFRGQRLLHPSRESRCLRVAHVHGPVERERKLREHPAVLPSLAVLRPEMRMRNPRRGFPFPVFRTPKTFFLVSAAAHELEIFPIRHGKRANAEFRYLHEMLLEFVVPTEIIAVSAPHPQRRFARGDAGHSLQREAIRTRGVF